MNYPGQLFATLAVMTALTVRVAGAAPVPVTVTVTNSPGFAVPADFSGLSFGAVAELPGHGGVPGLMFSATNEQLITLFKNSGLHHLRLGGTTVEGLNAAVPHRAAIDGVFGFARAADVKVIYSLPLLNGDRTTNAATAKYIWDHYRPLLDGFALGNEPDVRRYVYPPFGQGTDPDITNYETFLDKWKVFAAAITAAAPGATFAGPDAANHAWAPIFARDEKSSGLVSLITQHYYVGGRPYINADGPETIPVPEAIDHILSTNWVMAKYPALYQSTFAPVATNGLPCRMTEADDYLKGIPNASDSFASALWALEYLHWWAAHGCVGVNFHNTEWLKTDTVYFDTASQSYQIHPKAYGIKVFELGSHGAVEPVAIANENGLNLSAYAIGDATGFCVTVINKEHGAEARDANVTILPSGTAPATAEVMSLRAPNGGVSAISGIILGGAPITNNAPWHGEWTPLKPDDSGQWSVPVPASSALLIKFTNKNS